MLSMHHGKHSLLACLISVSPVAAWWQYTLQLLQDASDIPKRLPGQVTSLYDCRETGLKRNGIPLEAATIWNVEGSPVAEAVAYYSYSDCNKKNKRRPDYVIILDPNDPVAMNGVNVADFKGFKAGKAPLSSMQVKVEDFETLILAGTREIPVPGRVYHWNFAGEVSYTAVRTVKIEDYASAQEIRKATKSPAGVASLLHRVTEAILNENSNRENLISAAMGLEKQVGIIREAVGNDERRKEEARRALQAGLEDPQEHVESLVQQQVQPSSLRDKYPPPPKPKLAGLEKFLSENLEAINRKTPSVTVPAQPIDVDNWTPDYALMIQECGASGDPAAWYQAYADKYEAYLRLTRFYGKLAIAAREVRDVVLGAGISNNVPVRGAATEGPGQEISPVKRRRSKKQPVSAGGITQGGNSQQELKLQLVQQAGGMDMIPVDTQQRQADDFEPPPETISGASTTKKQPKPTYPDFTLDAFEQLASAASIEKPSVGKDINDYFESFLARSPVPFAEGSGEKSSLSNLLRGSPRQFSDMGKSTPQKALAYDQQGNYFTQLFGEDFFENGFDPATGSYKKFKGDSSGAKNRKTGGNG
ncbi:hypothetical protein ABW19_dt0210239 [Dactylella cylindrospora]|nr:hypothetical protein ABW19_dt0210239 [Dactylella cylindrospora]